MKSSLRFLAGMIIGLTPLLTVAQPGSPSNDTLYLYEYVKAPARILDFNHNKLLIIDAGPQSNPRIVDVITHATTVVPCNGRVEAGYITPQGAVLNIIPAVSSPFDSLYDFNNGILNGIAQINRGSIKVEGNYCIWAKNADESFDSLFLRDLITQTNKLITHQANRQSVGLATRNEVTANGLVAYIDSMQNLVKYLNNNYTSITNYTASGQGAANPLSDGYNIAYQQKDESIIGAVTTGPQGDATLVPFTRDRPPLPKTDYQVNNRYVAFRRFLPDFPWTAQLWLRDPNSGEAQILTDSLSVGNLELLNPKGDVMLFGSRSGISGRWLVPRSGTIKRVNSAAGKIWYRDSSWYITIDSTLYILRTNEVLPPPVPQWQGWRTAYCSTAGAQAIKITNLPGDTSKTHVLARLDGATLPVNMADSTFTINPGTLSAGTHILIVQYTNSAGASADTAHFTINTAVTPIVKLSADVTNVPLLPSPINLTATNTAGGGATPTYTFAKDRAFTNILQAQSSDNTLRILSTSLNTGANKIYVRMLTSDTCYTTQTAVDSITLYRLAGSGIVDPDNPHQVIHVLPNPFYNWLFITGLNSSKTYLITLRRSNGSLVFQRQVTNASYYQFYSPASSPGVYYLSIYDKTKEKMLGTVRLLKIF